MGSKIKAPGIVPCLWFDDQAQEAAEYYTGIFLGSKITAVSHYPDVGQEEHGKAPGSVLMVEFSLGGQKFTALNAGPQFRFTEAISLQVICDTQDEIDYFWDQLSAGGDPAAQQCSWLKDRFGLSWQIVPRWMIEVLTDKDPERMKRAFVAMLKMKKLDLAELKAAADGK